MILTRLEWLSVTPTLFSHLEDGYGIDEIIENFPTLDRSDVLILLREAHILAVGQDLRRQEG